MKTIMIAMLLTGLAGAILLLRLLPPPEEPGHEPLLAP
ncbi:hypothetical protein FHS90_003091 [Rufibacter quisquiliarum]|uniref:Uncharacterized protein n=1 Tax=Rufibacter quisquiliarum TaxID=1549639 RepID=A0A839GS88_9BACT|nr:hypothetical protein [Rufibacter quisquiliarum]